MLFTEQHIPQDQRTAEKLPPPEIPVPANKVLYIDLDGTLIDSKYQITATEITAAISELQSQGWLIGLSSDTPLEPLRTWRERFGMNGDIIAERGCILEVSGQVYGNTGDIELFQTSLQKMTAQFSKLGCRIWSGDTVEFIRSGQRLGNPGETVILINEHRTQSLGLYVRRVTAEGSLEMDSDLTNQIIDRVRPFFPQIDDLRTDLNHEYGILILSRNSVAKRQGTLEVMTARNLTQIGMIGNSMTDFIGSDIALHYAVANASPEFKQHVDYVASEELTAGVVQILRQLCSK